MTASVILQSSVLVAVLTLVAHYYLERRMIHGYAFRIANRSRSTDPFKTAVAISAAVLRDTVQLPDDLSFINIPPFSSLGSTPVGVLQNGGCCSGKTRLAIVALNSLGIRAAQATLYHASGNAQHCLVEVAYRKTSILMDPMYGLYFVDASERPVGIAALRAGVRPQFRLLEGDQFGAYPANDYYNFDFRRTGTANWTKSRTRRTAYRLCQYVTGGHIDHIRQPGWMEWPQLVTAWFLMVCLYCAYLIADVLIPGSGADSGITYHWASAFAGICLGLLCLATLSASNRAGHPGKGYSTIPLHVVGAIRDVWRARRTTG